MRDVLEQWRPVIDAEIERLLPRTVDEAYLADFFGPASYAYSAETIQRALSDPVWALLDRGGKRWRAVLFLTFCEAFGEDPEAYLPYACIPEILHNGTIIVDDVEDGATMRRGAPALHHEYGVDVALNAGNAMYFLPLKIITRNPGDLDAETRLAAYEMLMDELNRTHLGQGMDICWHNERAIDLDEDEYLEMCACKTGCLGRIVARLAAIVTGQDRETELGAARYAERMSVAFQVADDVLDVETSMEAGGDFGKGVGNDVREGKKTLMVIHAAEHAPAEDVARLEELLWAEENTDDEVREVVDLLDAAGSVTYARERAEALSEGALDHLDALALEPEPAERLAAFARFVVDRDV
ncbi:polyprenyl synthetase family protein [Halomarina ordinaria]|uniref:Polyprenyl synthetase family protein n=1 Tax=Halomarina ordinaria TaxID=3033939 RepID=A0ABD5UAK3_9EURY|nr:polyprenyl synthetase family protein [Halomarina sp. PSRA2]